MNYASECRADDPKADQSDNAKSCEAPASVAAGWGWSTPAQAEQEAQRIFQRTLSAWAMDVLSLRRLGLMEPGCRAGESQLVVPA